MENLQREKLLMIVTSTFGNGDAPTNGKVILSSVWIYLTSFKCHSFLFFLNVTVFVFSHS